MTPEDRALRDAWIAECWKPCREIPREERAAEKALREVRSQPVRNGGDKRRKRAS